MSQLAKSSFRTFIAKNITVVHYWVGLISAYLGVKIFAFANTAVFASTPSDRVASDSLGGDNAFADIFFKFLGPLQDFAL